MLVTMVVLGLCAGQAEVHDEHRQLVAADRALEAGRFAAAQRTYLETIGFPGNDGPFLNPDMELAVTAAASLGQCGALRARLDLDKPQHRYLAALLNLAGGDLKAARGTLEPLVAAAAAGVTGTENGLVAGYELLAFTQLALGDGAAAAHTSELAQPHLARTLRTARFEAAMSTGLFAAQLQREGKTRKALQQWSNAVRDFERAAAGQHPFLAFALEQQAALFETLGQPSQAKESRLRAAKLRQTTWCR